MAVYEEQELKTKEKSSQLELFFPHPPQHPAMSGHFKVLENTPIGRTIKTLK